MVVTGCHTRVTSVGGLSRSHTDEGGGTGRLTVRGDSPASARHCRWGTEQDVSNRSGWKMSHFYIC